MFLGSIWVRQQEEREQSGCPAQKWDADKVTWASRLRFQAESYKVRELFPEVEMLPYSVRASKAGPEFRMDSPDGAWRYVRWELPKNKTLSTWYGSKRGTVSFDGSVVIPILYEAERGFSDPWMSLTPAELLSLRPGTKRAKGHVVIGGLGMGHQLIEVALRKQVKQITLVERSQSLIDFILPRVRKHLPPQHRQSLKVVVGDFYEAVKPLQADIALVDIFPGYAPRGWERRKLAASAPGIADWWMWGGQGD